MKPIHYSGYYINLDSRPDRREHIENQIKAAGLTGIFNRFSAVAPTQGEAILSRSELGCFLSHQGVINGASLASFTIILEDDAVLSPNFANDLNYVITSLDATEWDILFLGHIPNYQDIALMHAILKAARDLGDIEDSGFSNFKLIEGAKAYKWGTSGYVIHPSGLNKLRHNLTPPHMEHPIPYDDHLSALIRQGRLKAYIIFPSIVGTSIDLGTSMNDREDRGDRHLYELMSNVFVKGMDQQALLDHIKALNRGRHADIQTEIVNNVVYHRLSMS
jgi:GR25 family glycosyltransferase involved in LPS biosynthesis